MIKVPAMVIDRVCVCLIAVSLTREQMGESYVAGKGRTFSIKLNDAVANIESFIEQVLRTCPIVKKLASNKRPPYLPKNQC